MRQAESGADEERLVVREVRQLFHGGGGDLPVGLVAVVLGEDAPVHQGMVVGGMDELLLRTWHAGGGSPDFKLVGSVLRLDRAVVKDLAAGEGEIAVPAEVLRQRDAVVERRDVPDAGRECVDAGRGGPQPGQQAGPRWIAERRLAVGVGEESAAGGQPVHVRRLNLRMTLEAADPVVQIVDGDHQDIGTVVGCWRGDGGEAQADQGDEEGGASHGRFVGVGDSGWNVGTS